MAELPKVKRTHTAPTGAAAQGIATGIVNILLRSYLGDVGTPVLCGSKEEFQAKYGTERVGSGVYEALNAFGNHCKAVQVVRVKGTCATITIKDRTAGTPLDKMTLTAIIDGTFANYSSATAGIRAVIDDGTLTNTFKLTLTYYYEDLTYDVDDYDSKVATFVESWDNLDITLAGARYFPTIINASSKMVVCVDAAPTHVTEPDNIPAKGNYDLAGGVEPVYTGAQGIDAFKRGVRGDYIIADVDDSGTRAALVAFVNDVKNCRTILSADMDVDETAIAAIGAAYDVERAALPYPWQYVYDPVMGVNRPMRVSGLFAGMCASLLPEQSPLNKPIELTQGPVRLISDAAMETLDDNHIIPVTYFDDRGVRPRTGKNMSTDPNLQAFERGVMEDYVGLSLVQVTGYSLGDLMTPRSVKALVSIAQGFLQNLKNDERIEDWAVEHVDDAAYLAAHRDVYRVKVLTWQSRWWLEWNMEVGPDVVTVTKAA